MDRLSNPELKRSIQSVFLFLSVVLLWHIYRYVVEVSHFLPELEWGKPLGYLFYLGFYILMFSMLVVFVKVVDRSSLQAIGLRKAERWRTFVGLGVLFAFAARFIEISRLLLAGGTLMLFGYPSPALMVFFTLNTLIIGLAEEGIFRGYIQRHLTHAYGFIPGLIATSVLFGAYHLNFFRVTLADAALSILSIAPSFGMFAGYFYHRTGENLLGPVALHMFYDLFGTIASIGVDVNSQPSTLVSFTGLLQWSALILALKVWMDRKEHLSLAKE